MRMIQSRNMIRARRPASGGKNKNCVRVLTGKPEEMRPLGRRGRRWEDNIRKEFIGIRWDGVDWIDVARDRDKCRNLVNTAMTLRIQ
jgi:hypothetical protein